MKQLLCLLIMTIISILSATVIVFLNYLTNSNLHTLTILFIIPASGLLIGGYISQIYVFSKKITQLKIEKTDTAIVALASFLTFFFIYYISYKTTYLQIVNNNREIVNHFIKPQKSSEISNFITFKDYLKLETSSSTVELSKIHENVKIGKIGTLSRLIAQLVGLLLGSIGYLLFVKNDSIYCDKCNRYFKSAIFGKCDPDNVADFIGNLSENSDINSFNTLQSTLKSAPFDDSDYTSLEVHYCLECFDGYLVTKTYINDQKKGEFKEAKNKKTQLCINPLLTSHLLDLSREYNNEKKTFFGRIRNKFGGSN